MKQYQEKIVPHQLQRHQRLRGQFKNNKQNEYLWRDRKRSQGKRMDEPSK